MISGQPDRTGIKSYAAGCAVFFAAVFTAAAFFAAHRFFRAATIAFRPAAESLRFGLEGSDVAGAGGSDSPRILAPRRSWPCFIRRRVAAENFFRLPVAGFGIVAGPPGSMARSSAICASVRSFCCSKPTMAAVMISFVSLY
jgi:hypothetical protein